LSGGASELWGKYGGGVYVAITAPQTFLLARLNLTLVLPIQPVD
jgi:hypothetical protein